MQAGEEAAWETPGGGVRGVVVKSSVARAQGMGRSGDLISTSLEGLVTHSRASQL